MQCQTTRSWNLQTTSKIVNSSTYTSSFFNILVSEIMHCIFISNFSLATHMNKAMIEWSTKGEEEEREIWYTCTQIVESIFFPLCNEVFHLCLKKQNKVIKSFIVKYLSYWLDGPPPNYLLFIFAMGLFDWPITQKKTENWVAPQNKRFLCEDGECCLWLNYISDKGENLGQRIWDKVRSY